MLPRKDYAERKIAEIFCSLVGVYTLINSHRTTGLRSVETASQSLLEAQKKELRESLTNPTISKTLSALKREIEQEGEESVVARLASESIAEFKWTLDASLLVFAHTMADSIMKELCTICAELAVPAWIDIVGDRKISIKEFRQTEFDRIIRDKAIQYLSENISLPEKSSLLVRLCGTSEQDQKIAGLVFDKPNLHRLHNIRKGIVHGDCLVKPEKIDGHDLDFLLNTCIAHMVMTIKTQKIEIKPENFLAPLRSIKIAREKAGFRKPPEMDVEELLLGIGNSGIRD